MARRRGDRIILADVRYWHKADMAMALRNVCYRGNSGHGTDIAERPLVTRTGHRPSPQQTPVECYSLAIAMPGVGT